MITRATFFVEFVEKDNYVDDVDESYPYPDKEPRSWDGFTVNNYLNRVVTVGQDSEQNREIECHKATGLIISLTITQVSTFSGFAVPFIKLFPGPSNDFFIFHQVVIRLNSSPKQEFSSIVHQ